MTSKSCTKKKMLVSLQPSELTKTENFPPYPNGKVSQKGKLHPKKQPPKTAKNQKPKHCCEHAGNGKLQTEKTILRIQ